VTRLVLLLGAVLTVVNSARAVPGQLPADPFAAARRLEWALAGRDALSAAVVEPDYAVSAGWGSPGAWLQVEAALPLGDGLSAAIAVAGTSAPDGEGLLGTHTTRGGWTGRVVHATLTWRRPVWELEWGRRSPGAGLDHLNPLDWPHDLPPVDLLRLRLHSKDEQLALEWLGARLESVQDPQLNRWFARHRLVWRPAGSPNLRLTAGDQVLFTGNRRGFDLRYANPFLPFFLENFEGYSEVDHGEGWDQDNSSLFATWDAWLPVGPDLRLGCYGQALVDEFQLDGDDSRRLDDALGLMAGLEARRELSRGRLLRLRGEAVALSHWTYIHRGTETSFLQLDQVIGNQEGGDVREWHIEVQLADPGQGGLLALRAGRVVKGSIAPGVAWDAESTHGGPWPLPPRRSWWTGGASWVQPLPRGLSLGVEAGRRTDQDGWSLAGRLRLAWRSGGSR
jgi:hypothetical protein